MQISFPLPLRLLVLASLAVALMVTAASSPTHDADAASHPVVWGDVTCDNIVDLQDVADLMRRSSGLETSTTCPWGIESDPSISARPAPITLRLDPVSSSAHMADTISVSVFADIHDADLGLGYASFEVRFDPAVLTPIVCTSDIAGCNALYTVNSSKFALAVTRDVGLKGTTKLGTIDFVVSGAGGRSTSLSLQAISVGDQLGRAMESDSSGATVSVQAPESTVPPGTYWYFADVNCDGSVTVLDALSILEHVAVGQSVPAVAGSCRVIGS